MRVLESLGDLGGRKLVVTGIEFGAGVVMLVAGAELLVRGASRLAAAFSVSPLIIGLTIVAFGTSSPELAVSVAAGLSGEANIAVGNVVGSNIFNVLFILGLCALISPLTVSQQLVRLDVPILICVSLLLYAFGRDLSLSPLEGGVLFLLLCAYLWLLFQVSKREKEAVKAKYTREFGEEEKATRFDYAANASFVGLGLVLLIFGADFLVSSAVVFAKYLGLSDFVIAVTIIAAGTSLPEVLTSVVASLKGERDIAVGNVVGSNIFNILGVLGITALVTPGGVPVAESAILFDFPVLVAVAIACFPIFFTGHLIARWEGAVFFFYYIAYTTVLVFDATNHPHLNLLEFSLLWFVLPLTVLTICVSLFRALQTR